MKVYYIIFLVIITSCNGQKVKKKYLKENKDNSKIEEKKVMNKDTTDVFNINGYVERKKKGEATFILENGNTIRQLDAGNNDDKYYIEYTIPSDSDFFSTYKEYYSDGSLKLKGELFLNDFNAGIWYYYDQQGNIENSVDCDKPFKFTWEQVKDYLIENKCDLKKDIIMISRYAVENASSFWELDFNGKYKNIPGRFVIRLDGVTGEEIIIKQFMGKKALGESGTIADYNVILDKTKK